jgi:hypothetical protein
MRAVFWAKGSKLAQATAPVPFGDVDLSGRTTNRRIASADFPTNCRLAVSGIRLPSIQSGHGQGKQPTVLLEQNIHSQMAQKMYDLF